MRSHGFGECEQFCFIGIRARRIDEAERQPGRAIRQLSGKHRLHRGPLCRGGGAAVVCHHGEAQRGVAHQRDKIERYATPMQRVAISHEAVEDLLHRRLAQQS